MRRMAIEAADVATGVGGFCEVRLLAAIAVAGQTAGAGLLPRMISENVDLSLVAAASHMVGAGAVATFTALMRRILILSSFPVGCLLPAVINFLMTAFASFRPHVFGICG